MLKYLYLVIIIIIILLTCVVRHKLGGASNHGNILIDTLNITNELFDCVDHQKILATIKQLTAELKPEYTDRIMFVIKSKTHEFLSAAELKDFQELAVKLRIYIFVGEDYDKPDVISSHSQLGKDDFLLCVLAQKYKCEIITNDRLADYKEFAKTVKKFKIIEYNYWQSKPSIDYINPAAFVRLRRPKTIDYIR